MKDLTLGEKIRFFRKQKGLSQLELEVEIGASPGSVSRIEAGKVNPTKETLINITEKLNLSAEESASLFDIDLIHDLKKYIDITSKLINSLNLDIILQNAVNEICYELNLLGSFVVIKKDEKIFAHTFTQTYYSAITRRIIGKSFNNLNVNLQDRTNLMAQCIRENKIVQHNEVFPFIVPAINMKVAKLLQKISGVQSGIAIPIKSKSGTLGAIYFCRNTVTRFDREIPIFTSFADIIGNAMQNADEYNKALYTQ